MIKSFLMSRVRKLGFFVAPIFSICIKFLVFLFLDKFTTVSLSLLPTLINLLLSAVNVFKAKFNNLVTFNSKISNAPTSATLLSSMLNGFEAKFDDLIAFNSEISGVLILLKSCLKR